MTGEWIINTKAIYTILVGDRYVRTWKTYCEDNWRRYAARHGYDVVIVDQPIRPLHDLSVRPIHWQKLFIPFHPQAMRYESIVFLDADIIINYHRAPCIVEANGGDKIGMVRFDRYVDDDLNYYLVFIRQAKFQNYVSREKTRREQNGCVRLSGPDYSREYAPYTPRKDLPILNTGVMVMKPALHRELLESIYRSSLNDVADGAVHGNYEQEYLAYKLLSTDSVHLLDERFNVMAYFELALHYPFLFMQATEELFRMSMSTILSNSYFLHFAGNPAFMPYAVVNEEEDFAIMGVKNVFKDDLEIIQNRTKGPHPFQG